MNCPVPGCTFSTKIQNLMRIHMVSEHSKKPKGGKK